MSVAPGSFDQGGQLTLTSDTVNQAHLREFISRAAVGVGFEEPVVSQIVLAVDEAITNVIKHGYQGRSGQPIEVTIEPVCRNGLAGLQIIICDCGRQVNPATIVGRKLEDVRPGGLGTHIIRNVMDEVEYSLREPTGMRLRMSKLLPSGVSPSQTPAEAEGSANG